MKNLTLVAFTLFCFVCYSQENYKFEVVKAEGFTMKLSGEISISDSLITIKTTDSNGTTTADYDVVNKRNGLVYITDGVATHRYQITESPGKKKGFNYSKTLTFEGEKGALIVYYLALISS